MSQSKNCIGPFGFSMRESAARVAEAAIKQQPKEIRDLFKTKVLDASGKEITVDGYARRQLVPEGMDFKEVGAGKSIERSDVAIITTDAVDRDGEVVMANGLDFSAFNRNPVVAFAHKYDVYGVGMAQWVAKTKVGNSAGWKAKTVYAPRPPELPPEQEWFADTCWWLGKTGHLRGRSIGFIPTSVRPSTSQDARERAEWASARRFIETASVLEYSVCLLPCQPEALIEEIPKAKAAGFVFGKSVLDALGLVIPESIASIAQAESPIVIDAAAKEFTGEATGADGGFAVKPTANDQPPLKMPQKKMSEICAVLPDHVHAMAKAVAKSIDKKHLADGDQPDELHPHVKFLDSNDPSEVEECVKGYGSVSGHLGATYSKHVPQAGDAPAHDRVCVKVHSYDLKGLHERLAVLPHNEKQEEGYQPHIHLANAKPGMGEACAKELGDSMPMEGMSLSVKCLRMKMHDGGLHDIHLDSMGKAFKSVLPGVFTKSGEPVICPRCQQGDCVESLADDDKHDYFCTFCGSEFDEDDKPTPGAQPDGTEATKPDAAKAQKEVGVKVNSPCELKALAAAKSGNFSEAAWSAPVGADRKSEYCLGEDLSAKDASPARLKFPIFDAKGMLNREAVSNAVTRAGKTAPKVAAAAKQIIEAIAAHEAEKAKTAKAMTDEQMVKAIESHLKSREAEISKAVAERATDLIMGRLGRV